MPSVTTNDGKASRATSRPLTMPRPRPTPSPAKTASGRLFELPEVTKLAATMPETDSSDPTDRSMPLARMTQVMPIARIPLIEVWRRMLTQLPQVMKLDSATASTAHSATKARKMP